MEETTDSRDVFDGASSSSTKASEAARLEQNGTERHASSKGPKSFAILVRVMWNAIIFYFERSRLAEANSGIRLPRAMYLLHNSLIVSGYLDYRHPDHPLFKLASWQLAEASSRTARIQPVSVTEPGRRRNATFLALAFREQIATNTKFIYIFFTRLSFNWLRHVRCHDNASSRMIS